ncbi:MAG: DsrE family protein [Bacteroidota bacterium]
MKKVIISIAMAFITSVAFSQNEKVKIIFDVTSSDSDIHETVVRHVKGMSEAYPDSEFEVVIYSGALPMMLKSKSSVKTEIESLAKSDNVSLKVCAVSLKRNNATEQDLISGVGTVPDGIMEIITKQNQGWGYIKEAN